jgi:hypothetical protein
MKPSDVYDDWVRYRRAVPVPPGFADEVMQRVRSEAAGSRSLRSISDRAIAWTGGHFLSEAAAIVLGFTLALLQGLLLLRIGIG